ncbi:hypothetical protein CYMTET_38848 [Cymbomonas tetramitiformis]|uniref:PROP1-like PPR domain-containing protein n=1 Tax=Cymbomonas tetramitiformis TaxID=36881 RepID=A0AAE0CD95_9CHLO|nr:hypothetical protein CYMTET_38848 [Cymbomonas tetramitiformis]
MRAKHIAFDTNTYEILLKSCASSSQQQLAFELYGEMRQKGVPATPAAYHALFQACLQEGNERSRALHYYSEMKADGVSSGLEAVRVLLRVCAAEKPLQAGPMHAIHQDAHAAGLALNAECWQLVFSVLAQSKAPTRRSGAWLGGMVHDSRESEECGVGGVWVRARGDHGERQGMVLQGRLSVEE